MNETAALLIVVILQFGGIFGLLLALLKDHNDIKNNKAPDDPDKEV